MGKLYKIFSFFVLLGFFFGKAYSTHLKAGEIIAQRVSTLEYRFILYLYLKKSSVDHGVEENSSVLNFGDGTSGTVPMDNPPGKVDIGNDTYKCTYTFYHVYPGGGHYTAWYQQENRNNAILNINGGASDQTPFYLETSISISFGDQFNSLPSLNNPPIGYAKVGEKYIHNPAAYDFEGDSLTYELTIPKQSPGTNVGNYVDPNQIGSGGTFYINRTTGDLVWDAPKAPGLYNVAFVITEWKNGKVTGTIERDMQIEVKDTKNNKPTVYIPKDTCIEAGTNLAAIIRATDPDLDKINITAYGGVFKLPVSPAQFNAPAAQASPASGQFTWSTTCDHIREQPYLVVFKADDIPATGDPLFDEKTWSIRVVAPKPQGLTASSATGGITLNWIRYSCSNAVKMQIYRKDCDSAGYISDPCTSGLPATSGFKKIVEVPIALNSFKDTSGINPGSFYCYRIVAVFPLPKGGKSYPSDQACIATNLGEPLPTQASVEQTDSLNGKIRVQWTQPFQLDTAAYPGPYKYQLLRADGLKGNNYTPVATLSNLSDTVYVDSLINTKDKSYNYKVEFYYASTTLKASSVNFSSVFLSGTSGNQKASLTWTYDVPWKNENHYHRIYRKDNAGAFTLIDSVLVSGGLGIYTATELKNGDTVCFYVETEGEYCRSGLPEPLVNKSQVFCVVPHNDLPPCPPILSGPSQCMDEGTNQLTIFWQPDLSPGCNTEISGYNVYYAEHEDDAMVLLASGVKPTFFVDADNFSLAGCYTVTALNYYGGESAKSNKICVDLCVYYELPNLITPNKDDQNDVFRPFPVPKNVKQVNFTVFNRWGQQVYYSENDVELNWPGVDSRGNALSSGIYYYEADVFFRRRLNRKDDVKHLKGWVHVLRSESISGHD